MGKGICIHQKTLTALVLTVSRCSLAPHLNVLETTHHILIIFVNRSTVLLEYTAINRRSYSTV